MKKLNYLLLIALIGSIFTLASCNKDDDDEPQDLSPTFNFTGGQEYISADATVEANQQFKIGVSAFPNSNSNKKLENFKVTQVQNNNPTVIYDSTFSSDVFQMDWIFTAPDAETEFNLIFKLTDKAGETQEKTIKITVEKTGTAIYKFTDITMGSWNDTEIGSFYSTVADLVYLDDEALNNQGKVDWCYFKGAANGETFAATDDATAKTVFAILTHEDWTVRNETRFAMASTTASEFDAISDGDIIEFEAWTSGNSNINNLSVDDVVLFKLQDGRLGYIKVVDTFSRGDRIKIDVIVQVP
ncbi:MAG: hypothetical protein K9G58_01705 [Bacteroidales bacterium]|nr:hypothetical protein [Bacteroidales bacterium]MCF8387355.1 hypothetical protein [Bacteroidales bacterium]MCF8396852.1 hypothetical protein [Bacteroidales bacterium]